MTTKITKEQILEYMENYLIEQIENNTSEDYKAMFGKSKKILKVLIDKYNNQKREEKEEDKKSETSLIVNISRLLGSEFKSEFSKLVEIAKEVDTMNKTVMEEVYKKLDERNINDINLIDETYYESLTKTQSFDDSKKIIENAKRVILLIDDFVNGGRLFGKASRKAAHLTIQVYVKNKFGEDTKREMDELYETVKENKGKISGLADNIYQEQVKILEDIYKMYAKC